MRLPVERSKHVNQLLEFSSSTLFGLSHAAKPAASCNATGTSGLGTVATLTTTSSILPVSFYALSLKKETVIFGVLHV